MGNGQSWSGLPWGYARRGHQTYCINSSHHTYACAVPVIWIAFPRNLSQVPYSFQHLQKALLGTSSSSTWVHEGNLSEAFSDRFDPVISSFLLIFPFILQLIIKGLDISLISSCDIVTKIFKFFS